MAAKRKLYGGVVVPTTLYEVETWSMRGADWKRLDVFKTKCLQGMLGV